MINILGLDPSFRNWGWSMARVNSSVLMFDDCGVITSSPSKEDIPQNQKDIASCLQLYPGLLALTKKADIICIEAPHGSQSSRAMVSYGVCMAYIAAITHLNPNVVLVSANDVKRVVGLKNPSKRDVINWVINTHSDIIIPKQLNRAEHICDSIAAIHAAMQTNQFKELLCKFH